MAAPYRSPSQSRTTLTELMIPSHANFGGKIHGGHLLELMDRVAYAAAARHAGGYCVTIAVDGVHFRAPVEVGDLVSLRARVNFVGRTSMLVGIRVDAENVVTGESRHTNTSFFTMVAKDDAGRPREVPGLLLETREDVRRYLEAIKRRELEARFRSELDEEHTRLTIQTDLPLLEGHRCRIIDGLDLS